MVRQGTGKLGYQTGIIYPEQRNLRQGGMIALPDGGGSLAPATTLRDSAVDMRSGNSSPKIW